MAKCEDFPCCGHYDEGTYNSWCPDPETGKYPAITLDRCEYCGIIYDPEEPYCCDGPEEDEYEEELEEVA